MRDNTILCMWPMKVSAWRLSLRNGPSLVLAAMRRHPLGHEAAIIGEVVAEHPGQVLLRSRVGGWRIVDMLSGEQLPRIC